MSKGIKKAVLKTDRFNVRILFLCMFFMLLGVANAYAACSPGIPCTGYDVINNPTAGTDPNFNGPKTGTPNPHTNTTGSTTSACDGNFMNQIYSRAFMEASREVIMSEQMIHKPDSVLEYTCFDQRIFVAAHNAGTPFSESDAWEDLDIELWTGGEDTTNNGVEPDHNDTTTMNDGSGSGLLPDQQDYSVFEDDRLDNVLDDFILDTIQDYVDDNFDHTFLGEASTVDNSLSTGSIGGNTYDCAHMQTVWYIAKCIDFGEDDRFRTFSHLVNSDPRSIPEACSPSNISSDAVETGVSGSKLDSTNPGLLMSTGEENHSTNPLTLGDLESRCPPAGGPVGGVNTDFSNDLIRVANNCDDSGNLNAYSSFDPMKTYNDLIKGFGLYVPGTSEAPPTDADVLCSLPIPTGIPVISYTITTSIGGLTGIDTTREYSLHYDHVCPNPGCYYQPIKIPPPTYVYGTNPFLPVYKTVLDAAPGVCLPRL